MQNTPRTNNTVVYILALVAATVIALAAVMYYSNTRKPATLGERIDAATEDLSSGVKKATDDVRDRTPAQKAGDALENAGDKVKDTLDR